MSFMFEVPEASAPATEICSEISAANRYIGHSIRQSSAQGHPHPLVDARSLLMIVGNRIDKTDTSTQRYSSERLYLQNKGRRLNVEGGIADKAIVEIHDLKPR
jgi:hypothetical protein